VWAHPFWDIDHPETVLSAIDRFTRAGLDGVEAFYPTHDETQARLLYDAARERGLSPRQRRLPRPAARALQPLRGVRDLRHGARARPDRRRLEDPAAGLGGVVAASASTWRLNSASSSSSSGATAARPAP
jgi:hypothetical protein